VRRSLKRSVALSALGADCPAWVCADPCELEPSRKAKKPRSSLEAGVSFADGLAVTYFRGAMTEEAKQRSLATIPLGRFSTPLDVANACLYLASHEASLVSGVCIEVDGARCV